MLVNGEADVGIATESLAEAPGLRTIPVYTWQHVAIVPPAHALARFQTSPGKLTLKDLARHPLITYEAHFAGRGRIDAAFAAASIEPSIVLEAIDADVIKTYVQLGMGVGIVAGVAVDPQRDRLAMLPCGHLFGTTTTRLAPSVSGAGPASSALPLPSAAAAAAALRPTAAPRAPNAAIKAAANAAEPQRKRPRVV
jgi:LysR family cys regulon transcriptional activator